jgi:hypothetical protein
MKLFNAFRVFVAGLLFSGVAYAQGIGASGDIRGTVTDPSGAVINNGTVTATDAGKGIKHTATTDSDGQYHITALPPAAYDVSVAHAGFQTSLQKGVIVNVGETMTLDFHLKVSTVSEQVEVTTEPPLVETEKSAQSNVISQQYIQDLPINRRDYLTFTLLAPAVSDSTRMAGDQDFRVKQTPQSGLSFYGSNGRGNSVTVDGGENNDDAGGVRLNLPQEAVQEFQINRSNYGADLGGAGGASINIVSKSGGNNVHGSVFGLIRNDNLDEANPFAITQALVPGGPAFNPAAPDVSGFPTPDVLKRYQFGGSVGMPITRDKSWLFIAGEGLVQNAQTSVPLVPSTNVFRPTPAQQPIIAGLAAQPNTPVPCLTGQPALPSATCAAILTNIFTVNPATPLGAFALKQFTNNGGLFPYGTRQYLADVRFDHQFSEANQVYLHYNFGHDREENPDVQSLVGFSAGSAVRAYDHNLQGNWFHQFSPRTLNEARVQWNYTDFNVIPNSQGTPGLNLPGFAFLNTNIFLPNFTIMRRYEFADNLTLMRGHHTLKLGAVELLRGNHTESHTFFPSRFQFGNLLGGVVTPCLQVPAACATSANSPMLHVDPASISSLENFNLGLPLFYQQGFGSPIYSITRPYFGGYFQDAWTVRPNLTFTYGVRYEVDSQYGNLKTPKNNFAPRASFAWDPWGDHKTVIRGGYGIFYSQIYGQIPNVIQTLGLVNGNQQIAQVFVPLSGIGIPSVACGASLTSACMFQTLFAQGVIQCPNGPAPGTVACITPGNLTQFSIVPKHDGTAPLSVFFSGEPNYRSPYSQQAEFGIEHQIGKGLSVAVSGVYVHTIGLPTSIDKNNLPTAPFSNITLASGTVVRVQNFNTSVLNPLTPGFAPCAGAAIVTCFARPAVLQDNVYSSEGAALYEGGILEIKKRFSDKVSLMVNYTFSKAFSTSTDFNSDFGPQNNLNLAGERGLSDFDQRHKVVIAGVLESPFSGKSPNTLARIFANFQLAPIVRYNSGHPFNLLAGADVNGDRHSTNDRPIGVAHNTGVGPDYSSFDMRVSRRFRLTERANLQVIAEGFNIFNTINYAAVNNVVDPAFLLPTVAAAVTPGGRGHLTANVHGSANIAPNQPLGFTSAFPMRQIQLGARVTF